MSGFDASSYVPCDHVEQCCDACKARQESYHAVYVLSCDAGSRLMDLRSAEKVEQRDLFSPDVDPASVAEWERIYHACYSEANLLSRLFWNLCPQQVAA